MTTTISVNRFALSGWRVVAVAVVGGCRCEAVEDSSFGGPCFNEGFGWYASCGVTKREGDDNDIIEWTDDG